MKGCEILPKRFTNDENEVLNIDQCFKKGNKVYFIEQKVRDDHDSTKKRGQISNFEKKLDIMLSNYTENELVGVFYFIDPDLVKNRNFYASELAKMTTDYKVETQLFYGKPLFDFLGFSDVWSEILDYLTKWKQEIPDFPEINFDIDAKHTFEEIKDLKPLIFRKLFENDDIFNEIILTLFPTKETLFLLLNYFENQDKAIYKTLTNKLHLLIK